MYEGPGSIYEGANAVTYPVEENSPQIQRPTPIAPNGMARPAPSDDINDEQASRPTPSASDSFLRPDEAPPTYEEAQARSVADKFESHLHDR